MKKLLGTLAALSLLAIGPVDAHADRASAKTAQKVVATGVIIFWGDAGKTSIKITAKNYAECKKAVNKYVQSWENNTDNFAHGTCVNILAQ